MYLFHKIFNNYLGIIRFIRAILQYVENKLKAYNNDLTRCLFCVCKCCLWCLEKFMRFINRNAYIMCAIKSTNFCVSAKDAFSLLMRNIVRVLVLNNVSMFVCTNTRKQDFRILRLVQPTKNKQAKKVAIGTFPGQFGTYSKI